MALQLPQPFLALKSETNNRYLRYIHQDIEGVILLISQTQIERRVPVVVPLRSKVTVRLLATKASCDIPFYYSQHDTLISGIQPITYHKEGGLYTGESFYNFYQTKQIEQLPSPPPATPETPATLATPPTPASPTTPATPAVDSNEDQSSRSVSSTLFKIVKDEKDKYRILHVQLGHYIEPNPVDSSRVYALQKDPSDNQIVEFEKK